MTIYISHSRQFDFQKELYEPLCASHLNSRHTFILPHEESEFSYETKELFLSESVDVVLAEVTFPSTGQGIELGWADMLYIPIVCIYKLDTKVSESLYAVSNKFMEYLDSEDMIEKITAILSHFELSQN